MENNQNQNTGSKGVFPGVLQNHNNVLESEKPPQINTSEIQKNSSLGQNTNKPKDIKTYFRMESKNADNLISGILEIDLISFREKGEESRYLKLFSIGSSEDGNQSQTTISIDNELDFNNFKKFISDLNWND